MATVNDILRVTLNFTIGGDTIGNLVHHYRVTVGTDTDYIAQATAIDAALATAYAASMGKVSVQISPVSLELALWDTGDLEWDGKASVTATVPDGLGAGEALPAGVAALMRFPTDELRRQARKFIPGLREDDVSSDTIQAAFLANLVTSAALVNNDVTAGALTLRPCTFNDTVGSVRFNTSSDFSTTSIVNTNVAYQRRRQPGAGI